MSTPYDQERYDDENDDSHNEIFSAQELRRKLHPILELLLTRCSKRLGLHRSRVFDRIWTSQAPDSQIFISWAAGLRSIAHGSRTRPGHADPRYELDLDLRSARSSDQVRAKSGLKSSFPGVYYIAWGVSKVNYLQSTESILPS